jgi:hypothetical protein
MSHSFNLELSSLPCDNPDHLTLSQGMIVIVFRTLQRLSRLDLASEVVPLWLASMESSSHSTCHQSNQVIASPQVADLRVATILVRELTRAGHMQSAQRVADAVYAQVDQHYMLFHRTQRVEEDGLSSLSAGDRFSSPLDLNRLLHRLFLPDLALGHALARGYNIALSCLKTLNDAGLPLGEVTARRLLKQFIRDSNPILTRQCLRLLAVNPGYPLNHPDSVPQLVAFLINSINFVKGAVSMATLPPESHPGSLNVFPFPSMFSQV